METSDHRYGGYNRLQFEQHLFGLQHVLHGPRGGYSERSPTRARANVRFLYGLDFPRSVRSIRTTIWPVRLQAAERDADAVLPLFAGKNQSDDLSTTNGELLWLLLERVDDLPGSYPDGAARE